VACGSQNCSRQVIEATACPPIPLRTWDTRSTREALASNMLARADLAPRLGGASALFVFVTTLLCFVVESQLAQVSGQSHPVALGLYLWCGTVCAKHPEIPSTIPHFVSALWIHFLSIAHCVVKLYRPCIFLSHFPSACAVSFSNNEELHILALQRSLKGHHPPSNGRDRYRTISLRKISALESCTDTRHHRACINLVRRSSLGIVRGILFHISRFIMRVPTASVTSQLYGTPMRSLPTLSPLSFLI
jgi:hypothetical protein